MSTPPTDELSEATGARQRGAPQPITAACTRQALALSQRQCSPKSSTTANDGGWQQARPRRSRPAQASRAASPTPSASSTSTRRSDSRRSDTRSAASRGASSVSAASTHRLAAERRRVFKQRQRPEISTLAVGNELQGTVSGVKDFGAFIDCGVSKDGLLHASEADPHGRPVRDLRERVNIGESLRVWVKDVNLQEGKFTLTARDPTAALAAAAAAAEARHQERMAREAEWERRKVERAKQEEGRRVLAQIETAMVEEAKAREVAAAAARIEAGMVLPAAAVLCGTELPAPPTPRKLEVLVERFVNGKRLVLYKMPWNPA